MQNIDYSRKLRSGRPLEGEVPSYSPQPHSYLSSPPKPKSAFILLIGGILLFTSGMVVGIQLGQKETKFKENSETSFSNVGSTKIPAPKQAEANEEGLNPSESRAEGSDSASGSPFPATLKFPTKK